MVVGGVGGEMGGPLMDELTNNIIALMAKLAGSHGNNGRKDPMKYYGEESFIAIVIWWSMGGGGAGHMLCVVFFEREAIC